MGGFAPGEIRTGQAYEVERTSSRAGLAASASLRRVRLADDLVLVFTTRETVRAALEEVLRAERVVDEARIAAETEAFGALLARDGELAATLFVDVPDPLDLADRLAQLPGLAETVFLEVDGRRLPARSDGDEDGSGVFHLVFELGTEARAGILRGAGVAVGVDHAGARARTAMTAEQVTAVAAGLA